MLQAAFGMELMSVAVGRPHYLIGAGRKQVILCQCGDANTVLEMDGLSESCADGCLPV